MKVSRFIVIVLVALLVMQGLAISAFAGPPAGTWVTGIQVQNVSTAQDATITVTFYWAAGVGHDNEVALSFTDTIPMGKAVTYYLPTNPKTDTELPPNFVGSVVVSSDVEVAAIMNTDKVAAGTGADPLRKGAALGVKEPSTTEYAPYLRKNYYDRNSYIAVQNTANTTATVRVRYLDTAGAEIGAATETAQVPAFSTKIFYQNDNAGLPNGFYGSAVITGTLPLATVINNANLGTTVSNAGFESYNGFADSSAATKVYLPKLTVNYYGYQTGFQCQNTGNAAAYITVTYKFGASVYTQVSPTPIQPGQAWSVFLASSSASGIPNGFSGAGSAILESTQPMVAIVSERNDAQGFSVVTTGVGEGSSTSTILFPKFDTLYYNYNGGIQVQNLGTVTTTLRATFSMQGRADVIVDRTDVAPGGSAYWFGPSVVPSIGSGFGGSVVVISLESQPIAGVYTGRNDVVSGDSYTAYNGIPK